MNKLFAFLLCYSSLVFSQNLEEDIYVAAETFIANPSASALEELNSKEAIFKAKSNTKDEHLALVFLQSHKGFYLEKNGKLKQAIATFEDGIKRFRTYKLDDFSDFNSIESYLIPLGNLYTKTGDYTNALSTINHYVYLAEKNNLLKYQVSGAINLAKLYYSVGNHAKVIEITNRFVNNVEINELQKQKLLELNKDSKIALGLSYSNIKTLVNGNNSSYSTYQLALKNQNYKAAQKAFKNYKDNTELKELSTRQLAQIYIEEAQLYLLNKDPTAAKHSLQNALKILIPNLVINQVPSKTMLYAENKFIDIFDLYATMEPNSEISLQHYDKSFYVAGLLQTNWTSQESRILNETNNRKRSEKCIEILYNIYAKTGNKLYAYRALQYAENNKVSVLKEMFKRKLRLQQFPNDTLLIKELNLLKQQEQITSLLIKEEFDSNRAENINELSVKLNDISIALKSLKEKIKEQYPNNNSFVPLEVLQNKLKGDNAQLCEYFYGNNRLYQFIISANNIRLEQIPYSEEIQKEINAFTKLFDNPSTINTNITTFTQLAFNIYNRLNISSLSRSENIILIPDGLLNFIPFETLLSSETTTTIFSKMPFLVKKHNIIYNSSVLFYTSNKKTRKNENLLGVFPVFKNTDRTLTFSINEANAIKDEMPSELLLYTEATKSNFIKKATNYGILHLSTHANSGSFVTPASIDFYDDKLTLNELYGLDLNSNLAVLSACETGVGKLYKGEGPMSIARGFQYSGVKHVLFSLWQINDYSTSQIITSFYKNYSKTTSASLSNRASKLEYLQNESIDNIKKSPYYWGAFVYYGEIEATRQSQTIYYVLFGILIVAIIVLLRYRLKRSHGKFTK